jgi:S-formylglutathione hydrolase FrmB
MAKKRNFGCLLETAGGWANRSVYLPEQPQNRIFAKQLNFFKNKEMNRKKMGLLGLLVSVWATTVFAAKIDTVATHSPTMQKNIPAIVIKPDTYTADGAYPVVYLLHGYGGNYTDWLGINGEYLARTADVENLLIVLPDGGRGSWYFDVPDDANYRYETYIATELVQWIDAHYATRPAPEARGISGLSMGGHGALFLAFRHPEVFGVAGSMSGGVDIRPFPLNWELAGRLGSYAENPEQWEKNTVINLTYRLTSQTLKLIIDCGTEDFFYTVNRNLHQKLLENNIPHDFISRPGKHNADYWRNAVQYQLLFMTNHFRQLPVAAE